MDRPLAIAFAFEARFYLLSGDGCNRLFPAKERRLPGAKVRSGGMAPFLRPVPGILHAIPHQIPDLKNCIVTGNTATSTGDR
jgi:hypothetical protein